MNLDWGIVWDSRHALLEGAGMTVLLTVATMALAVPGGIVLALMRLSSNRLASKAATVFVEFFRNLPLILVIYWAFYVMPMALDVQLALDDRAGGAGAEHLGLQLRDLPRRHQFHPQGPDGSGAGDGHVAAPGHVQGADPTGGAACCRCWPAPPVQGHLAGVGDRGERAGLRLDADPRAVLPRAGNADRDGGDLLADGLSPGQAGRLDPPQVRSQE